MNQNTNLNDWVAAYEEPKGFSKMEPVHNQQKHDLKDDIPLHNDMDQELNFE